MILVPSDYVKKPNFSKYSYFYNSETRYFLILNHNFLFDAKTLVQSKKLHGGAVGAEHDSSAVAI